MAIGEAGVRALAASFREQAVDFERKAALFDALAVAVEAGDEAAADAAANALMAAVDATLAEAGVTNPYTSRPKRVSMPHGEAAQERTAAEMRNMAEASRRQTVMHQLIADLLDGLAGSLAAGDDEGAAKACKALGALPKEAWVGTGLGRNPFTLH